MSVPAVGRCGVLLGDKMEEVKELSVWEQLCKQGSKNKRCGY